MQQVPEREERSIGSNVMSDDELRPSACPMVSRVPSSLQRLHALSNLYAWLRLNLTLPDNLASAKRTLVEKVFELLWQRCSAFLVPPKRAS